MVRAGKRRPSNISWRNILGICNFISNIYSNINFKDHCAKSIRLYEIMKKKKADLICDPRDMVKCIQTQNLSLK